MKYLKLLIVVILITITACFTQKKQKMTLENSVLWKIEHPEIKEISYILGTLHLICEKDFSIPEKVNQKLKDIDALVLEINPNPEELEEMKVSMSNSKKISEEISEEKFKKLDSLVKLKLKAPLINFDNYGLSTLYSVMIYRMLPCDKVKSMETELTQLANKNQIPIYSLEKLSDQMEAINKAYSSEYLFEQMMIFESYKKDFIKTIEAYKKGDITSAVNFISKEIYMNENATEHMLTKRNDIWAEKIPNMMKEGSNLFAVGVAHLTTEKGIINILRKKGFTITPVFN